MFQPQIMRSEANKASIEQPVGPTVSKSRRRREKRKRNRKRSASQEHSESSESSTSSEERVGRDLLDLVAQPYS